jgi:2,4-dichlorophenol 6-monooxygenase
VVHNLIGDKSVRVKIKSISTWTVNHMHAEKYSTGRVFCMGDAVHRHPPSNGLGSNTSIQDAYNLAWKMAHVLKGKATPKLLETFNIERAPIGKQIVDRANKSISEFGPIFDALGLLSTNDPKIMKANMEARKEATPLGAQRREKLRAAIAYKVYEFDCHGVEMNHRYKSKAVVTDGTPMPKFKKDAELYHQATSWPGSHVPHVWLEKDSKKLATVDLCGNGKFTLLTSIGGEAWVNAAKDYSRKTGLDINTITIGPGCDIEDPFGDWARAREIEDNGCLLVRPDMCVGFRAKTLSKNPGASLHDALNQILGH